VPTLTALQLALLNQKAARERSLQAAEPIAVIGVGCRFPAGPGRPDLASPDQFWDFLCSGGDAIGTVPASRWALDRYYDPTPGTPGRMHCRHGAFLAEVDQFDPVRFGISQREAEAMDPQQRLILETALDALERSGLGERQLRGSCSGVYMGISTSDYALRQVADQPPDSRYDLYFATGNTYSMAAGRLAYVMGLQGPAMTVDTACSSSLVAVDLACRSLRDRNTDLALAGGSNVMLSPLNSLCFSRSGMMASDGHCKTFDAAADGYVRGEGCGVVVLKRLADALAAGDPILAVIRASGVNHDGASAGLTVPNGEAQHGLMRRTLAQGQLDGDQIDVLEAHGTGTALGDPIELRALAPVYARPERGTALQLGSVKTNLGHLEAAAGIAGLIKCVLMLQHGRIPPHLHLRQPTPYMNWGDWKLQIPTTLTPWPRQGGEPRRAAVSSFGFSGTNAHVVLEQAPVEAVLPWPRPAAPLAGGDWLVFSALDSEALRRFAQDFARWLPDQPEQAWAALCATARRSRSLLRCRLALRAASAAEAAQQLRHWLEADRGCDAVHTAEIPNQPPRLALLLSPLSRAEHWQAWQQIGLRPSALVFDPGEAALAHELAGTPPQLRLIPREAGSEALLAEHGYGAPLPLEAPAAETMVRLWLAGHAISWDSLDPAGLWPRQALPTTPFSRTRCWIDEASAALDPGADAGLIHLPSWTAIEPGDGRAAPAGAELLLLGGPSACRDALVASLSGRSVIPLADLQALEAHLSLRRDQGADAKPELVVLQGLASAPGGEPVRLDQPFWQEWLPLLQQLTGQAAQLDGIHWAIDATATAGSEALAALLRCWARELGAQAGGLLRCGAEGQGLKELLLANRRPSAGDDWRWDGSRIVRRALTPQASAPAGPGLRLPSGATTIISGGLGALGLATARWLQQRGATHLTLLSRRSPQASQQQVLDELRAAGTEVVVEPVDVCAADQVRDLTDRLLQSGRPLAGVIHAAGVLDDGLVTNQTADRCAAVAAPKVLGLVHLDRCTRELKPCFFITYSSLAATLGSPGQTAYGAANGWLDGYMQQRQREGLSGLSVNWGPWAGGGMAARSPQHLDLLEPDLALQALGRCLEDSAGRADTTVVIAHLGASSASNPLADRVRQLADQLASLEQPGGERGLALIEACLAELLGELSGFNAGSLDRDTRLEALGLDSLMAVDLATAVQAGLGVSLGLGALSGDPTLGSLASHLHGLLHSDGQDPEDALDLGEEATLPGDLLSLLGSASQEPPAEGPGEAILFTGATGFLGAYLLADQLNRYPDLSIYCLVRADGPGMARSRVRSNLEHYGLWQENYGQRLIGVPGNLAEPRLGLDPQAWEALTERLSGILHNGAQLSYVAPYGQLRASNVLGTLEVLRLAAARCDGSRQPLPVEFISSTSVYEAAAYRGRDLDETSDLSEWQGIHLGYSQTKWVSERLVWNAALQGLPVRIYRPPLIAGHSLTGAWHEQDFLHRLMRGCLQMGLAPDLTMSLDLVPVDYVVAAVGAMAWRSRPQASMPPVFHLHHPEPVLWTDLLDGMIAMGAPLRAVPLDQWLSRLATEPGNPLYPLQPFFTHRWGPEQLTYPELNAPAHRARPACRITQTALNDEGLRCPAFSDLLQTYARTFLADLLRHG
jgi:thioester reductase-like protein